MLNYARYSIRFFIGGEIKFADVLNALKRFGQVVEISWKTFEGMYIKTGEHTVFMQLDNIEYGGYIS